MSEPEQRGGAPPGEASPDDAPSDAAPKVAAPALTVRATPPRATRLRGVAVKGGVAVAALVATGAFIYAFILSPQLKAQAAIHKPAITDKPAGDVRPNEKITGQPAGYDQIGPNAGAGAAATSTVLTTRDGAGPSATDPGGAGATPNASVSSVQGSAALRRARPVDQRPPADSPVRDAYKLARTSDLFFGRSEHSGAERPSVPGSLVANAGLSAQARSDYEESYGRHVLIAPQSPYEIKAGTLVTAALLTAVDTGRPGPVVAITTAPLFDTVSGRTLLIPQGSRLIGQEGGDNTYGEGRAFVVWKRLILPNGKSLLLEDQAGTDAAGAVGVPGRVDHRWLQLGGAILASGAITTLGEVARSSDSRSSRSLVGTVGDATAVEAASVGGRLIDRELRVQPKVRVAAGAPVQVLLTKDLVLEPYAS